MQTTVDIEGKTVSIKTSAAADRALSERGQPLLAEMELYFSCLVRKQVRFHEAGSFDNEVSASEGLNVTSVDFSESGIKRLNELSKEKGLKIDAIQTDIRKINFPDNSFDVIYAHLSLHYFDVEITTQIF